MSMAMAAGENQNSLTIHGPHSVSLDRGLLQNRRMGLVVPVAIVHLVAIGALPRAVATLLPLPVIVMHPILAFGVAPLLDKVLRQCIRVLVPRRCVQTQERELGFRVAWVGVFLVRTISFGSLGDKMREEREERRNSRGRKRGGGGGF